MKGALVISIAHVGLMILDAFVPLRHALPISAALMAAVVYFLFIKASD